MKIRILTIIFTEECPLKCRYCFLERQEEYGTFDKYKKQEIWSKVEDFKNSLKEDEFGRVCFSGGEPLLYWDEIKEIISYYGNSLGYEFNTSAYLLTREMLEFLSEYIVVFNLSVDGGEKFANWRRPLKSDSGGIGYYKHVKNIFPALLYYFPNTKYKVIVCKRCIDLMLSQYLEAEKMGFRNIDFVIDLNERGIFGITRDSSPSGEAWSQEDYNLFTEQLVEIAKEICSGLAVGIERAHVCGIDNIIASLLQNNYEEPACKVLDNRTNSPMSRNETFCLKNFGFSPESAKNQYLTELEKNEYKCPRDNKCPFFKGCLQYSCLQDNYGENGQLTYISTPNCNFYKGFGIAALNILNFCHNVDTGPFIGVWLSKFLKEGDYAS